MTIENHAISNEPSTLPAWLVIAGFLVGAVLIGVGMWMDHQ